MTCTDPRSVFKRNVRFSPVSTTPLRSFVTCSPGLGSPPFAGATMIAEGSFSAKADGIASPAKIHNTPAARATLSIEETFIRIPDKGDSSADKLAAFPFVKFFAFRISSWKFPTAHPKGRSGAMLLRFSGGRNDSDRAVAGLAKPAPRVALTAQRREAQGQAHSERPLACRNQEVLAVHSPPSFLRSIEVPAIAPANSPLPRERQDSHRGPGIAAAHHEHLRPRLHRAMLRAPSSAPRDSGHGEPHPTARREFPRRGFAISARPGNPAALPRQTGRCFSPRTSKPAACPNRRRSLTKPAAAPHEVAPEKFPARHPWWERN